MNVFAVLKTLGFVLMALAWDIFFIIAVPFSELRFYLLRKCKRPLNPLIDKLQRLLRLPYTFVVWSFSHLCMGCMGVTIRHVDKESEQNWRDARKLENTPRIAAFQHVCTADPLFVGSLFPDSLFVLKRELRVLFIMFYPAVANGFIDVARDSPESRADCATRMINTVAIYNDCLAVAPEGTRNRKDPLHLLPFKKGAFIVSTKTGAPVIPIVHYYGERCFEDRNYSRFMPKQSVVAVKVLPAIHPNKDETVEELQERVRAAMQAELDKGKPDESLVKLSLLERIRLVLFPVTVFALYAVAIFVGIHKYRA